MKVSYNGLWKILIDKNMNKKELAQVCKLSPATVSKMGRGELFQINKDCRVKRKEDFDYREREINEF